MRVHLHTSLRRPVPAGPLRQLEAELPASSTLADLLWLLELSPSPPGLLLVVNGRSADLSQALAEGDEVHLMPALSGG